MSAATAGDTNGHSDTGHAALPQVERDRIDHSSVSDLISRLGNDATVLFRQEVELAKVELKQELTSLGKAGGMLVAAAILGFTTLLLVAWTIAWGLAEFLPIWVAFLITAALFAAGAAAVGMAGRKKLGQVDMTPRTTIETLQQDKQMISDRMTT